VTTGPARGAPQGVTLRPDLAEMRFRRGYLCSQAVLSSFAPDLGLETDAAFRIAAAFGGGIAGRGETCGAVLGACMALGLRHGRTEASDQEREDRVNALAQAFITAFAGRNGSILCRDLLGVDLGDPDGGRLASERNLFATVCPGLVRDAAEILERLLELEPARSGAGDTILAER
jgi:C_GCAxxG_C_C family probable redox protein